MSGRDIAIDGEELTEDSVPRVLRDGKPMGAVTKLAQPTTGRAAQQLFGDHGN